ncbi:MAG: hypothetical protein ACJ75F_14555, partial [Flavisolibacter sp.]
MFNDLHPNDGDADPPQDESAKSIYYNDGYDRDFFDPIQKLIYELHQLLDINYVPDIAIALRSP